MINEARVAPPCPYLFWTSPEQEKKDPEKAGIESFRALIPAYVYHKQFVPQLEKDLLNPVYSTPGLNPLVWRSMKNYDLKGKFEDFSAPALIVDGRQDFLGDEVSLTIHEQIPNSKVYFLDECSHYPWMDAPDEYFTLIEKFLAN